MNKLKHLLSKTLVFHLWQEFQVRYRFKYVLPHVQETVLDGVRLDLSRLSLKVRNRILMGIYEAHEKQMCLEFLRPSDSVLEIGGAIGFIGLICQKKIGIGHYAIVEANPQTLEILRANYRLNGLSPKVWNMALGPDDTALQLNVSGDFWENSVVPRASREGVGQRVTVAGAPLRSLLRQTGHPVNVLIIDVEGAEQFIDLDDIPPTVEKIIVEIHPAVLGAAKTYDLIAGLIQRGYFVAREESGTFAFLKRPAAVVAKPGEAWINHECACA